MRRWLFVVLLGVALPVEAKPSDIDVGLYRYAPPVSLQVRGPGGWGIAEGRQGFRPVPGEVRLAAEGSWVVATSRGRRLAAGPVLYLRGEGPWALTPAGGSERRFTGRLAFRAQRGRLTPVLSLPLESYLESVVADEMMPDWPAAALKAQAIAARSYSQAGRNRHRSEGYDFCDLTHCQLFRGLSAQDARVDAAVRETAGQVLRYQGRVATTTWHSTCGGHLAANTVVFGGAARPYLAGGPDQKADGKAWCEASPHFPTWSVSYGREDLTRALRASGRLRLAEPLNDLVVTDRLENGYTTAVRLVGAPPRTVTGYELWMALGPHFGWGEIKGPAFGISKARDRFTFTGRGLGHGVGMCQWGARGRALAGQSAPTILQAYFPGTQLGVSH